MPDGANVAHSFGTWQPMPTCQHLQTGVAFERERLSKLRSKCWMVERCLDCLKIMDQVAVTRGFTGGSGRDKRS